MTLSIIFIEIYLFDVTELWEYFCAEKKCQPFPRGKTLTLNKEFDDNRPVDSSINVTWNHIVAADCH